MDLHGWIGFGSGFLLLKPQLGCFLGRALTTFVSRVLLSGALLLLSSLVFQIRSFVTSSFCSSIASRGSYPSRMVGRDVPAEIVLVLVCGRNNLSEASFHRSGETEAGVESVIDHSADFSLRAET